MKDEQQRKGANYSSIQQHQITSRSVLSSLSSSTRWLTPHLSPRFGHLPLLHKLAWDEPLGLLL